MVTLFSVAVSIIHTEGAPATLLAGLAGCASTEPNLPRAGYLSPDNDSAAQGMVLTVNSDAEYVLDEKSVPVSLPSGNHQIDLYYEEDGDMPVDRMCIFTTEKIEVGFSVDGDRQLLVDVPLYELRKTRRISLNDSVVIGGRNNITGEDSESRSLVINIKPAGRMSIDTNTTLDPCW